MKESSMRLCALVLLFTAACAPKRVVTIEEVPKISKLDELMDAQATVADPEFKKIGRSSLSEADWRALEELAHKLEATSLRIKDFSKGPEFDALALRLHDRAGELGRRAAARDLSATHMTLAEIKANCKQCHRRFR
jgi:cytochrome c556